MLKRPIVKADHTGGSYSNQRLGRA